MKRLQMELKSSSNLNIQEYNTKEEEEEEEEEEFARDPQEFASAPPMFHKTVTDDGLIYEHSSDQYLPMRHANYYNNSYQSNSQLCSISIAATLSIHLFSQVEDLQRQLEASNKEQEALIDVFSDERNRRDQEEDNLRKKLKDASSTIQDLLEQVNAARKGRKI
ncbi:hypothetical protein EJB05_51016, partial [Eragrostis curvula]